MPNHLSSHPFLNSATAVIDALGGNAAAIALTGASPQMVTNWRARDRISPATFLLFTDALAALGFRADPALWGIRPSQPGQD
jgi:hypothetical protein